MVIRRGQQPGDFQDRPQIPLDNSYAAPIATARWRMLARPWRTAGGLRIEAPVVCRPSTDWSSLLDSSIARPRRRDRRRSAKVLFRNSCTIRIRSTRRVREARRAGGVVPTCQSMARPGTYAGVRRAGSADSQVEIAQRRGPVLIGGIDGRPQTLQCTPRSAQRQQVRFRRVPETQRNHQFGARPSRMPESTRARPLVCGCCCSSAKSRLLLRLDLGALCCRPRHSALLVPARRCRD